MKLIASRFNLLNAWDHFWSSDPRVDFDVCCLRVRNTAAAGELSLIDFQLPPSISIASIRENVISKHLQILKPPSGKRLGKYLERGWKISKRVNFRSDGCLVGLTWPNWASNEGLHAELLITHVLR